MILTASQLTVLSNLAEKAALEAGEMIQKACDKDIKVEHKKGAASLAAQVVTEVDRNSEKLIYDLLCPTLEQYDLAFLGEESEDDGERHTKDYFWCVDPLDGTLCYTEQTPGYAVSIALVSKAGKPIIGVVYDPFHDVLYSAIQNQGIKRNGDAFRVNSKVNTLTLPCDRSLEERNDFENIVAHIERWTESEALKGIRFVHKAGAVMNAMWALENPPACYFKLPKDQPGGGSLWDFAATACLYQEAGAKVCDFKGYDLDLNRIDSTFMNHRGVIYTTEQALVEHARALFKKERGYLHDQK